MLSKKISLLTWQVVKWMKTTSMTTMMMTSRWKTSSYHFNNFGYNKSSHEVLFFIVTLCTIDAIFQHWITANDLRYLIKESIIWKDMMNQRWPCLSCDWPYSNSPNTSRKIFNFKTYGCGTPFLPIKAVTK